MAKEMRQCRGLQKSNEPGLFILFIFIYFLVDATYKSTKVQITKVFANYTLKVLIALCNDN